MYSSYTPRRATPEQAIDMFASAGVQPVFTPTEEDITTTYAAQHGGRHMRDVDFLKMLGCTTVKAVDISDFEGAEILCDLNRPIPDELDSSCDLLLDGSTLDNIFDPVQGLKNIARMMKPRARGFINNLGNASPEFTGIPYLAFNPMWFFDYFVWNRFTYCQAYVTVFAPKGPETFALSLEHTTRRHGGGLVREIHTQHCMAVTIYAEKGADSTWDQLPIQHAYRPEEQWRRYEKQVESYIDQNRPPHLLSSPNEGSVEVPSGWVRIGLTQPPTTATIVSPSADTMTYQSLAGRCLRRMKTYWQQ